MRFLEFLYFFRMFRLHFGNLRIRIHQVRLYYKLVLLYLLDKSRCFSVLDSLNKTGDQGSDLGDGFKCRHNDESDHQKQISSSNENGQETTRPQPIENQHKTGVKYLLTMICVLYKVVT